MNFQEVKRIGLEVLRKELGIVGSIRFLQLYETGYGDYSKERHQWQKDLKVSDVVKLIEERRQRKAEKDVTHILK
jgi:hypothetical protein